MNATESQPYFTIVSPCCDVERYLAEMLASIDDQPFADWECVLSYEDSTDGTLALCEAAAQRDPRYRVVRGPRSGSPSTPRNRGLDVARGKYVIWLDGDDFLAEGVLAKLADALRAHGEPEVLQGGTTEFLEDDGGLRTFSARHFNYAHADDGTVKTGLDVLRHFADMPRFAMPMASLTVARRDFLLAHDLRFVPGLRYEDNEWTPRVVTFAERILVVDLDVYFYRRRAGSITTAEGLLGAFRNKALMFHHIFRFFGSHDLPEPFCRVWARTYVSFFFDQLFLNQATDAKQGIPAMEWTRCLRTVMRDGGRAGVRKMMRYAGLPKKVVAPFVLACGVNPILDFPARFYVRRLYHPLVTWRFRRRGW
jgi:glycosyltransferase involved in cell wall biosynthesis